MNTKTKVIFALCAIMAMCMIGCAAPASYRSITSNYVSIINTAVSKPIVAEYELMQQKVTGTVSRQIGKYFSLEDIKNEAVQNVLSRAQADFLIDPNFVIDINGSIARVTVTGFPAKYTLLREITEEDSKWLDTVKLLQPYAK